MDDTRKSDVYQRWDDGFVMRRMRSDENQQVIKWFGAEYPICYEMKVLMEMRGENVDDFYVGELNGEMVASLITVPTDDDLSYCGLLYVAELHRRSGFARRMLTIAHRVEKRRNPNGFFYFTTFPANESKMSQFCYKKVANWSRWQGVVSKLLSDGCGSDMKEVPCNRY